MGVITLASHYKKKRNQAKEQHDRGSMLAPHFPLMSKGEKNVEYFHQWQKGRLLIYVFIDGNLDDDKEELFMYLNLGCHWWDVRWWCRRVSHVPLWIMKEKNEESNHKEFQHSKEFCPTSISARTNDQSH